MAEIRFTTERMREVYNRLDEISEQLSSSTTNTNELLSTISNNIQSDNLKDIVGGYTTTVQEEVARTRQEIEALKEYLAGKIGTYSAVDQSGTDAMSEIENLLSQLEA